MNRSMRLLVIAVVVLLGLQVVARSNKATPMPEAFGKAVSFEVAQASSAQDGMPVLAFVTADWCGPCQKLKGGPLKDADVAKWITENTHPVYVDATNGHPLVESLGVQSYPTLMLLRGGKEVTRIEGLASTKDVLGWLNAHSGPVADAKFKKAG